MLERENKKRDQSMAQYFSFNVIQKISKVLGDYYLKKYENKIGIVYKGQNGLFMNYYENNEMVSSTTFPYEYLNQQEDDPSWQESSSFNSYDSNLIQQNPYCFCGKLEYLFQIKQLAGEIIQWNLKNLNCKTYNFENRPLSSLYIIEGIKKTNYLIMSWIDSDDLQSLIEIRDTAELQIKKVLKQVYGIYKILWSNFQKSQIATTNLKSGGDRIQYFSIREQALFCLMTIYGKVSSKITEMENYLIISEFGVQQFKLISLILKGKLLRKLCQDEVASKIRIKKYQNYYLLKIKFPNCACYQIYQWWNGKVIYSSKIKVLLKGKITSRGKKAKQAVYILKYQPIVAIKPQLVPMFDDQSSPVQNEISSIE